MSIKHKSDVENHLSIRPKRNLIHLVPASQPDATGDSVHEIDYADVAAQDVDTHVALQPASEVIPFGPSTSPDNFGTSIVEAPKA